MKVPSKLVGFFAIILAIFLAYTMYRASTEKVEKFEKVEKKKRVSFSDTVTYYPIPPRNKRGELKTIDKSNENFVVVY
jgi:hypothetical protein